MSVVQENQHIVGRSLPLAPFEIIVVQEDAENARPGGSSQLRHNDSSMHTIHLVAMPGDTTVQVLNPETHQHHGKLGNVVKYTDYEIRIQTTDMSFDKRTSEGVRRTFNEFLWLREQLVLTGMSNLPSLPWRTLFGCFNETFLENRRSQLQHFLEILVFYHPAVLTSSIFHKFVQSNYTIEEMTRMIDTTHALQGLPDIAAEPTIMLVKDIYASHDKSRPPSTCPAHVRLSCGSSGVGRSGATSIRAGSSASSSDGRSVGAYSPSPMCEGRSVGACTPSPMCVERRSNTLDNDGLTGSPVETARYSPGCADSQSSRPRPRVNGQSGGRGCSAVSRDSSVDVASPSPARMHSQPAEPREPCEPCEPCDGRFACDGMSERQEACSPYPTDEDSSLAPGSLDDNQGSRGTQPLLADRDSGDESDVFAETGADGSLQHSVDSDSGSDGGWCVVELVECSLECDRSTPF